MKIVFLFLFSIVFSACSPVLSVSTQRWSGNGDAPKDPTNLKSVQAFKVGSDRSLEIQTQMIGDVEVEGSYYKKILKSGKPEFISFQWIEKVPLSLRIKILSMKTKKSSVAQEFLNKYPLYREHLLSAEPQIVIRDSNNLMALWKISFQRKDGTLFAVYFDTTMSIVDELDLGSSLVTGTGALFPQGPLKSNIQQVSLQNLIGNKTLTSDKIKVSTRSDQIALSDLNQFIYDPEDARFTQVQVFFYLSESLKWFEKNLNFALPAVLEAETHVGFPEKTSTAFFYQFKIRLGEGDEEAFSKMSLDPSIVIHESVHAVIEATARLANTGEAGSINEAFADYFTAAQLKNPNMGESSYKLAPFKRSVENSLKLTDKNNGKYHDSGIVSGLLWEVKKELGYELANQIAWNTLLRLNPQSDLKNFLLEFQEIVSKLDPSQQKKVLTILSHRGWAH